MHDRGSAGMNPEMVWVVVISEQIPVLFELIVIVIIITLVSLCKKAGKEEDRRMRKTESKRQQEIGQKKRAIVTMSGLQTQEKSKEP